MYLVYFSYYEYHILFTFIAKFLVSLSSKWPNIQAGSTPYRFLGIDAKLLVYRRLLSLLQGRGQLGVLAKLADVFHITPCNDLALRFLRKRFLLLGA